MSIKGEGCFIEVNMPFNSYICKRKNFKFILQAEATFTENIITVEIARIEWDNPVRILYTFIFYKNEDGYKMLNEIKEVFEIIHDKFSKMLN